ncbi:MAG: hypothetical protein Q7V57_14270 [Actinomycetota bacterium]|nr:hypothetical protein [Actinomycetota bacterium]
MEGFVQKAPAQIGDIKFDGIDGEFRPNPAGDGTTEQRHAADDDDVLRPRRVRQELRDDAADEAPDEAPEISGQGSGDPIPTESISFNFGAVEFPGFDAAGQQGPGEAVSGPEYEEVALAVDGGSDAFDPHPIDPDDGQLDSSAHDLGREGSIEC